MYDIQHHYNSSQVTKIIQLLYQKLDEGIRNIYDQIFRKYAKTAITYYFPERNFVYLKFLKSIMALNIYTNQEIIDGVRSIKFHENWG